MKTLKDKISFIAHKRLFYVLLTAVFITRILSKIALGYIDSDTYFILSEGRDIVENGIKYINTFTVVPDLKIVVQQWLWCVIIYGIYSLGGYASLMLVSIVETIVIFVLLYIIGKKKNVDKTLLIILDILFLYFISEYISTRPNAITIILLLIEILVLENYKEKNSKRNSIKTIFYLTLLTLIEMNLHMSMWIFHFVFLLPYVFPPIKTFAGNLNKRNYNVKPLLIAYIPMVAVLFLNPYGIDGILYLFRAYGPKLNSLGIKELAHVEITSQTGALLILFLALYIGVYMVKKKPISAETFYLFAGTFLLGCLCYRNFYYVCIGGYMLIIDMLQNSNFDKMHEFINSQKAIIICLASAGFIYSVWDMIETGTYRIDYDWEVNPVKAVEYLNANENTKDVTVFTEFNNGAFIEWNGYKGYIDARPELYMEKINGKADIIDEYMALLSETPYDFGKGEVTDGLAKFLDFKEKYHFDYYLVKKSDLMDAYLQCDSSVECVVNAEEYNLYQQR